MVLKSYLFAFLSTARLLLVGFAFAALSYASMDIGYTDAMVFFAICGAIVLFFAVQRYNTELHERLSLGQ